jgi:hypothetical protein
MLNGAVNLGVLCFSFFGPFAFLALGVAFRRGLVSFRRGELDDVVPRPLRVFLRPESSPFVDRGVGGENKACSFWHSLAIGSDTIGDFCLPAFRCTVRSGNTPPGDHTLPVS